ncbi:hypothetical protein Pfo_024636 [Paulownia fortunei]|nr:hypothetical protein Pfo_024636 [Paulownia fortunei]
MLPPLPRRQPPPLPHHQPQFDHLPLQHRCRSLCHFLVQQPLRPLPPPPPQSPLLLPPPHENLSWNYKKQGSKKLNLITINKAARIFWDFSRAKYGSGPEPLSGFYVAVVIDGEFVLLVGDSPKEAYSRTGATQKRQQAPMVLRREHVYGTKLYSTKVKIGGHERNISIDCRLGEDPRLYFSIDSKRVLQIKHLKWKFRGNESIEIDGTYVQVSWDVYNWLFNEHNRDEDGYALFMFTIFHQKHSGFEQEDDCCSNRNIKSNNINGLLPWSPFHHQPQSFGSGFGFEEKKMKKKKKKGGAGLLMRSGRSSSSSSLSSANSCSSCASSVMEWANSEDDEFMSLPYSGFSLLVYAWKSE